jgi:hypothetical protein
MRALRLLRKIIVLALGVPLLLLGIGLIPVPGPGLLVCLVAFAVLSIEFSWARTGLRKSKDALMAIVRSQNEKFKTKMDTLESGEQEVDSEQRAKKH